MSTHMILKQSRLRLWMLLKYLNIKKLQSVWEPKWLSLKLVEMSLMIRKWTHQLPRMRFCLFYQSLRKIYRLQGNQKLLLEWARFWRILKSMMINRPWSWMLNSWLWSLTKLSVLKQSMKTLKSNFIIPPRKSPSKIRIKPLKLVHSSKSNGLPKIWLILNLS